MNLERDNRFAFNVNKYQFEKDNKYFAHLDVIDAHKIVKELNDLYEGNQQYKSEYQKLEKMYIERDMDYIELERVNDYLMCQNKEMENCQFKSMAKNLNVRNELRNQIKKLSEEKEAVENDNHGLAQKLIKSLDKHIQLEKENDELKQELELLKKGLKAYDDAIQYVCTCSQVRDIHSELFDFEIEKTDFYKQHPNRIKIVLE